MLSKNTSYIPRLDHLRFFAALLVVAYHTMGGLISPDTVNPILVMVREGESGVGLFMVLSGFILTRISLGKHIDYRTFLYNRLLRIYPLYVAVIAIAAYTGARMMDFTSILAMLSGIGLVLNVQLPKFYHVWTVAVEFQFYLIFPFLVAFLARYGARYIIGLIVLACIVRGMMFISDGSIKDPAYWTIIGRIDQFCIGMLAAYFYASKRKFLSSPIALAASLVALYVWAFAWYQWTGGFHAKESAASTAWIISPLIDAILWAFFALAYIEQSWRLPKSIEKALAYLGCISFSMYVWHVPVLAAMYKTQLFSMADDFALYFLIVMTFTTAISSLSYFIVEKPFFALRKVYVHRKSEHMTVSIEAPAEVPQSNDMALPQSPRRSA